ncbi:MAG TPA: hypothetical protein VIM98_14100 [Dyella sp.]|uniref:hypothetical protein n=1 Tax=Dyella sp. TaxID=1869338 RepID=UPI002F92D1BC
MKTPDEFAQAMNERKADPSKMAKANPPDPTSRSVGAILFVGGLVGAGYCWMTIDEAAHHAPEITYSWKIAFGSPLVLLIGLMWMILGEKGPKYLGPAYAPTRSGAIFYVVSGVLAVVCCYAFGHYLRSFGYDVGF